LLDGIEERGQVFVLATTNRPEHVDAALRRPGRFDQVVWMGLPDQSGRVDIFAHYLCGLRLAPQLAPDRLAAEFAGVTHGLTGADIAYLCQRAAMACVKEAVGAGGPNDDIAITRRHFDAALALLPAALTDTPADLNVRYAFRLAKRTATNDLTVRTTKAKHSTAMIDWAMAAGGRLMVSPESMRTS
jgi:transitional endoplasmic reticulum ATPase